MHRRGSFRDDQGSATRIARRVGHAGVREAFRPQPAGVAAAAGEPVRDGVIAGVGQAVVQAEGEARCPTRPGDQGHGAGALVEPRGDLARQLADLGARVIKIEPTEEVDTGGGLGGERHGSDFQLVHRNKRGMTLNLKSEEGRAAFRRMVAQADVVGSSSQLIRAVAELDAPEFIIATDKGIFHKMQQAAPGRRLIEAPTAGRGAACRSCAHCPWMAMNGLRGLLHALQTGANEIRIDPALGERAYRPIKRLLEFSAGRGDPFLVAGDA